MHFSIGHISTTHTATHDCLSPNNKISGSYPSNSGVVVQIWDRNCGLKAGTSMCANLRQGFKSMLFIFFMINSEITGNHHSFLNQADHSLLNVRLPLCIVNGS